MNPFGSSDEEETVTREGRGQRRGKVNQQNGSTGKSKKEQYPGDLNPFGEEDEEDEDEAGRKEERDSSSRKKEVRQRTTIDASSIIKDQSAGSSSSRSNGYNDSLNPFGSDDEADDSSIATTTTTEPSSLASGSGTPVPRPRTSLNPNNHSINSQPVSRETTPISLRRSIGSNVSRSSLDSRSRKVIKPSVPPPPAPASPAADPDPGSRSPLRPHRSPKKAPPPARPRQAQPMPGDKLLIVSPNDSSPNQSVVTVTDSQSNERIADPDSQPAEPVHGSLTINPDSCLTGKEGGTAGTESPTNCQMPVPARRRISLTPSAGSEATISTISVDSDQSHSNNNNDDGGGDGSSSNHIASQQDFHAAEDQAVSLLAAAQSSPSPSLDVKAGNESSPSPRPALKKRPAPAPPQAIRRTVCGSMQSIQFDLNGIGDRLAIIQSRVDQLEAAFHRDRTAGDQIQDQKSMITEYLELARETCTLGRKQEELMYQRTEHKLEQEHADLEFNIRKIDLIPKFKRTPEDEKKSKDMIDRLVDVIDQRNDVVENMTKINKRPDFDKRVERLRKMCQSDSELDAVLSAFLVANDMDVITTEMTSLTINNAGRKDGSRSRDQGSGKKHKDKKEKKIEKSISKSATLRLPHFKSKDKTGASGNTLSSASPPSNKAKSSTLKTIKKLGGGLKVKSPKSSNSSNFVASGSPGRRSNRMPPTQIHKSRST